MAIAAMAVGVAACGDSSDDEGGGGGGAGESSSGAKQLKVAVMYLGASVDGDEYSRAWAKGIQGAVEAYGADSVEVDNVTGVKYGDPGLQTIERLVAQDYDLVIETLDLEGVDKVCAKAPEVACMSYSVPRPGRPENVSGFAVDFTQAFFLEGIAAGMLSKDGVIGHVGSIEVPFQKAYVNATALGCQEVNPDCQVKVVYINSFFDPPKAQQATQSLLNAGADVINSFQDDPTPVRVAGQQDAWAFGMYDSMEEFSPEKYVTTMHLEPSVEQEVTRVLKAVADGTFSGPGTSVTIEDGYEPFGAWGANVPQDVQDRVAKEQQKIADGAPVFKGPITDTSGKVRVPEGKTVEGIDVYTDLDYYVKGVKR